MRIRFQADADLNQVILLATLRREPTIDFQTAAAAGLAHRRDREVLAIEDIILGRASGESQRSFKRWLEERRWKGLKL